MNVHANPDLRRGVTRRGRIASTLISVVSCFRGLPLLLSNRPRTPLRVLCIVAFDTLYILRTSKRLPADRIKLLAVLLDFAACANADCDNKQFCLSEYQTTRQLLDDAGIGSSIAEFLKQLRTLEAGRPSSGGNREQFHKVESYREAVVRLGARVSCRNRPRSASRRGCWRDGSRP